MEISEENKRSEKQTGRRKRRGRGKGRGRGRGRRKVEGGVSNNKLTEVEAPDFIGEVTVLLAADNEHVRVHFDGHVAVKRTRT